MPDLAGLVAVERRIIGHVEHDTAPDGWAHHGAHQPTTDGELAPWRACLARIDAMRLPIEALVTLDRIDTSADERAALVALSRLATVAHQLDRGTVAALVLALAGDEGKGGER